MAEIDLAFLARQLDRVIDDLAALREDVIVLGARVERLDAATHSLLTEVRAMPSRDERLARRVQRLEDAETR